MNGFVLQNLSRDADITVASDRNPSWHADRRKYKFLPAKGYPVSLMRDQVCMVKCQESGRPGEVRIKVTSDTHGALLVHSSRNGMRALGKGQEHIARMTPGEVLCIRTSEARDPARGHTVGLSV